ncbi:MAG: putative toxin-antitoxin system toxin component, PIN family [Spirochaetes bacterium]|nr:putative toxin-antitoxin system toxin component, PIN family [Spirochaetota bacterium]
MKIILDTNVLMSGIFFSGVPYQILKVWKEGKVGIVISEEILDEYYRVAIELSRKYQAINIDDILELLMIHTEAVDAHEFLVTVCEDMDDNKFLSCALASGSKIIISGDKHLLKLSGYQDIEILKPRQFMEKYMK